ncbi:glycosyltransferase family 4 protein [Dyella halodurans]|uniref:Glycosyltransferase family 4 protein n=1 Tax=Dyella halodurans TaxID=1920171 RepID=A0ABV9BXB1_9GAMM|nr:glycosyltransferase family 1 protein [Dyella halodurans]
MKIRIDMQGAQTDSRHRGIGRYCLAVTRAFIELARDRHDIGLLFNAALDGIGEAVDTLADAAPRISRRTFGPVRHVSSDNPANDARRKAAELAFGHALGADLPDVVWLGSVVEGFTDDALVPYAKPEAFTVATLYDLIPLHDPTTYLSNAHARDWYMRRLEVLKRCDLLLAISEWVRNDAIVRLGIDPERIVAIGAGVDARFAPRTAGIDHTQYLLGRFGIDRRFVMYNGGFDKRKNVLSLIEAFADLPAELRAVHALVLVGRVPPLLAKTFAATMVARGLEPDDVLLTGFVSDEDLVRLYQACALFAFPSEREGFGLAPLEAMACGAPTIVNDATSLPEVVDDPEALFDGHAPGALAARMRTVLTDRHLADRLSSRGLARARHFSWRAVAARALSAIDEHALGYTATSLDGAERPTGLPVYRVDAGNVDRLLPTLRQWPGTVVWSGPLPETGPSLPADRYRLGGYGRLHVQGGGNEWLALLEQDAAGVLLDDGQAGIALDERVQRFRVAHPLARQRSVEDSIAASVAPSLTDDDLARVADALDRSRPTSTRRWLVDVTHIATRDLGTGIHRVVRSILREWLQHPPEHVLIEPIVFREGRFHHAHDYACALIEADIPPNTLPGDLVAITGSEVYIGLDWTMESLPSSAPLLRTWRWAGVQMQFVVYDLLPLTMPDAFHAHSREAFTRWATTIASLGDVLHCISRSTAAEVRGWLSENHLGRRPEVTNFELGADASGHCQIGELDPALEEAMSTSASLLMVGTVEPRKGYVQVLDAMELLWEAGANLTFVIIGHRGWLVNDLTERLQQHREKGKRLFWLDNADDGTLEAVYQKSTVLVAASRGEGYGLPLIEAARRGKPVIARSLPVFQEVAGDFPSYFDTDSPEGLASHIARWLAARPAPGPHPEWLNWRQSAFRLGQLIRTRVESAAPP